MLADRLLTLAGDPARRARLSAAARSLARPDAAKIIVDRALERCKEELKTLERDVSKLENVRRPFPRISYREAIELLASKGMPAKFGDDLGGGTVIDSTCRSALA